MEFIDQDSCRVWWLQVQYLGVSVQRCGSEVGFDDLPEASSNLVT